MQKNSSLKKKLSSVAAVAFCLLIVLFAAAACGANGRYYLYEGETKNPESWIEIKGGKWTDDGGDGGKCKKTGDTVTLYATVFGVEEEWLTGTLVKGKLTFTDPLSGDDLVYLTDKAKVQTYAVTFDANGGSVDGAASVKKDTGKVSGRPPAPTTPTLDAEGSRFLGWYTERLGGTQYEFNKAIGTELTLYAHWNVLTAVPDKTVKTFAVPGYVEIIGEKAFDGCTALTSVTLPDDLKRIDAQAFNGCAALAALTLPRTVTGVGENAFAGCAALSVTWHYNPALTAERFAPSLKTVVIPGGVTAIGESAFAGCTGLVGLTIPGSVTSLGAHALEGCTKLEIDWTYNPAIPRGFFSAFLKSVTVPGGVASIPDGAFEAARKLTSVTLGGDVTSIGKEAFAGCESLTAVALPDGLKSIGDSAFYMCEGLAAITLPDGLTSIGEAAFMQCKGLTELVIPDSVTSIGGWAFQECRDLRTAIIGGGVTSMGADPFKNCYNVDVTWTYNPALTASVFGSFLKTVNIPDGVVTIADSAFAGSTGLKEINVDQNNPNYAGADGVLYNKEKTQIIIVPQAKTGNITLPAELTSLGTAFSGRTGLTGITIGSGVTSIGNSAFSGCTGLTSIAMGNGVTSIGNSAFSGCTGLTSMTLPTGLTSIGNSAFSGCSSLTSVRHTNLQYNFAGYSA
jgi:hypothetical protein